MAAFTFGSFGDILTLTSVVITCARSLNDSTGSVSDYQDFINELSSLKEILELVVSQNQDSSTVSSAVNTVGTNGTIAGSSPIVMAAIRSHIEQCRSVMETFHQNVKSYERGLNQRGAKSWCHKMVWSMWKKDQIMTFRAKLATHRQQIMTLLLVSQSYTLSRIENDMPRSVKFSLANSIELVDALGTRAFFHIDYCSNWKVFDIMIKGRFKNAPGGHIVESGDYNLCDSGKNTIIGKKIIHPEEWSRVVKPGMTGSLGPGCNARYSIVELVYSKDDEEAIVSRLGVS
ncbi:hypothetical protein BD410DRAFT_806801 [Rickenella mellea]|uniref:Ubiquitin-like domain-containing protein n=1 Tax=Rickenella mellea TaxID=50990 RepID=A0A4Y7PSG2_9AGAM|nr:hypothetical protein BD410DRAFT_806801 [Rickenella mellea]